MFFLTARPSARAPVSDDVGGAFVVGAGGPPPRPHPDEQDRRLQTFIPPGTTLLDADLRGDGTLVVDVGDAFFDAKGESQIKAVAQVVYTGNRPPRGGAGATAGRRPWAGLARGDGIAVSTAHAVRLPPS